MPETPDRGWILDDSEVEDDSPYGHLQQPPAAIIHLPHASRVIPAAERGALCLSDEQLVAELLKMTDAFTDEIFAVDAQLARAIVFPVSRLVVDPERFPDDAIEPMASRGMGIVYARTAAGAPLRAHLDAHARHALMATYYEPHHRQTGGCRRRRTHALAILPHDRRAQLPVGAAAVRVRPVARPSGDLHRQ